MAEEALPQWYRKAFQDMTGGLCTRSNALLTPANKFVQLDNAAINDTDILQKATGYILDGSPFPNSSDSFVRMLSNYKVGTTVNSLVCAGQDAGNTNTTYKVDLKQSFGDGTYNYIGYVDGTATFTNMSATVSGQTTLWTKHLKAGDKIKPNAYSVWYEIQSVDSDTSLTLVSTYNETTVTTGSYKARLILAKTNIPYSLAFNNKLLIVNGHETPLIFDNTTLKVLQDANLHPASFILKHKNRVFLFNWPGNTSGMQWSASNDETLYSAIATTTIFTQDNGNIVGAISYANSILVFKDNGSVYQVIGEFDQDQFGQPAVIRKIDVPDNLGIVAGRSICILEDTSGAQGYQQLGSKVYFLSETGIYTINSWMQVNKVSWEISPDIARFVLKSTLTSTKTYSFTSKSQWDTGTITGLSDTRVTNGISTLFDNLSITTAKQGNGKASSTIDSTYNVHTAYVGSDGLSVRYTHWLASDNSNVDSQVIKIGVDTIVTTTVRNLLSVDCVSIAVSSSTGKVGIVSKMKRKETNVHVSGSLGGQGLGSYEYFFSELSAGTWTHTRILTGLDTNNDVTGSGHNSFSYHASQVGVKVRYDGSDNPSVLVTQSQDGVSEPSFGTTFFTGTGATFITRTSGTWGTQHRFALGTAGSICDFIVDSNGDIHSVIGTSSSSSYSYGNGVNIGLTVNLTGKNTVRYYKSTDSGVTWTNPINLTPTGTNAALGVGCVNISVDDALDPILVYNFTSGTGGDVGKTVRYNVTDSSSSYLDSTVNFTKGYVNYGGTKQFLYTVDGGLEKFTYETNYTAGTSAQFVNGTKAVVGVGTRWLTWVASGDVIRLSADDDADYGTVDTVNSNTSITLLANYIGSSATGAYVAKRTRTVIATGSTVADNIYFTGSSGLINTNNVVVATTFGVNANEIRLRRVSLYGTFASPIESDATLSAWGTYDVGNPITNGNTIMYEVGVNTSGTIPESVKSTIVPGAIISTNASNIYAQAFITFIFGSFGQSSINSLIMNYVGAGADAILPTGYVYNNEMYIANTQDGQSGNTQILFLDRKQAWGNLTPAVCAFARYNQQLYAGSSTNGNIYKLRTGYNFNGSAYTLTAITKEDLLGSLELDKDIYKVYVLYESQLTGSFTFSYRLDEFLTSSGSLWQDTTIDQTMNGIQEVPIGKSAKSIQFKVVQSDLDVQVGIIGFIVLYKYLNLR